MPILQQYKKSRHIYLNPKKNGYRKDFKNEKMFEGTWIENNRNGFGVLSRKQNYEFLPLYKGVYKENIKCGYGRKYYNNNSYYAGLWKNNLRNGYGRMWYFDGSFYDGNWENDKRNGYGLFVQADGNRYEGEWLNNKKHGRARFFHLQTGQMQEGVWVDGYPTVTTMEDIPFRQTCVEPTPYPIPQIECRAEPPES